MGKDSEINKELVNKYKVDNTILESYFKNAQNQEIAGLAFPLRIDNRQYCSPTDHQGDIPSCCGYTTAQILEALCWMKTGKPVQFDANQIYAKAKQEDKRMDAGGTFPDLAMMKGLELVPNASRNWAVRTSTSKNISQLKRIIHGNMFASVNMMVTKDIFDLNQENFVYNGVGERAGGHSMLCCGYDEESKMLIIQNHWGKDWGLKGFFLCPYDVWTSQNYLTCWYERIDASSVKPVSQRRESAPRKVEQKESPKAEEQGKGVAPEIKVEVAADKKADPAIETQKPEHNEAQKKEPKEVQPTSSTESKETETKN